MFRPEGLKLPGEPYLPTGLLATGQSRAPAGFMVDLIWEQVDYLILHALDGCQVGPMCEDCARFAELRALAMKPFRHIAHRKENWKPKE